MRAIHSSVLVLMAVGALAHANTIIDNANGYTLDKAGKLVRFTSLAFDQKGRILAVGSPAQMQKKAPSAQHIDMQGQTVLPGLIDAHGHVFDLGKQFAQLDLAGSASLADALKAASTYAAANPQRAWLTGRGWNQEIWKLGRFPTAAELDAAVADRPVFLERVDGHASWANTRAMQLAGITKQTPDPAGGKIIRDANGEATGLFVDAAQNLVTKFIPPPTAAEARLMLERALHELAAMGLTSVHDAGIGVGQDMLYREFADAGKLTTRVYAMIGDTGADFDQLSKAGPLKSYAGDMYALRAVKLYADGALGSRGAALLAPYSDEPASHGLLFKSNAEITASMEKAMRRGYQVNVHAIGDAGNRQVLDAYQKLVPTTASAGLRHRMEHAQVVELSDIARFKSIGIIPSMQPTHATSDMNMAENRVGAQRIKGAYAWRTFLNQGSRIACGSDFPIESPNPFYGIHAAVTRQDANGQPSMGWHRDQAMTLPEALRCFTLDAAYAAHQENAIGSLEKGKWADFIVLARDPFAIPPAELHNLAVSETWVAGHKVYQK